MSRLALPICLVLALFCLSTNTDGCSCAPVFIEEEFAKSSAVFFGQVVGLQYPIEFEGAMSTTFKVVEIYKGNPGATVTVKSFKGYFYNDCANDYRVGQSYFVYADGQWVVGSCGGTKWLENAGEDYLKLGLGPLPEPALISVPRLASIATAMDADFDRDNEVSFSDFVMFAGAFGSDDGVFDLDYNGRVNFADFIGFVSFYGQKTESPRSMSIKISDATSIDFAFIESGSFIMGTTPEQQICWEQLGAWYDIFTHEQPAHKVTISKGFYLSKYEITQSQWQVFLGTSPWAGQDQVMEGPDYPAVYVGRYDAELFVEKLNQTVGDSLFRLPTEAEWEYACRGKTTTPWWFGCEVSKLGEYAWYRKNAWEAGELYAHKVGTKKPNPWGLYDMLGNVREWVQDGYLPQFYTVTPQIDPIWGEAWFFSTLARGGTYSSSAGWVRSSFRYPVDQWEEPQKSPSTGFRILMIDK